MSRLARRIPPPVWLAYLVLLQLFCGALAYAAPAASSPAPELVLAAGASLEVDLAGRLYQARDEAMPADAEQAQALLARLKPAAKVDLLGGAYWLHARVRNSGNETAWVLDINETLIDRIDIHIFRDDGQVERMQSGYRASHEYFLHYGKPFTLLPGETVDVLLRFDSPYYARVPGFAFVPQAEYRALAAQENTLIIGCLGALASMAIFNFFIYLITRQRASIYYAAYVVAYAIGWALTFHLGTDLFGWRQLNVHYIFFFLLPVLSTLFYTNFLHLKENAPRLYRASYANLWLSLLMLPSCFLALSWAHTLATLAIMIWMVLALSSGIVVWRKGYQPARFFVLGFLALLMPGLIVLPNNLGLMPRVFDNTQLAALLGGTLDGILLAFALADQIRLLRNNLEQRVQERTAELTEAKEHAEVVSRHRIDFLSAMSHDIRTPLAGVIGMLKFALRDHSVQGRTEEYLRIGLQNSQALLAILNDILDFSKIDAGRLSIETVDLDLQALVDDAIGILQAQADAKSLLLRRELALDLPRYVRGDPTRIRQILLNLLGNAIKFTDSGEVRLEGHATPGAQGKIMVSFSISDTGPGIPATTLPRLFQKFEQADHSTTRRYGGTGLGLAICKELVQLMGGTIRADSMVGHGSTFSFRLPLEPGMPPEADPLSVPRHERHAHKLRVLCAEDVRTNQIIISTLLESMGHSVHIVENGVQALEALTAASYDLVLMDGRMPQMDGEQATRLIRRGGTADYPVRDALIPIIALTANASDHDRARYLAVGMDGFLSKPVDERLLYDQIEKTIAQLLNWGRPLPAQAPSPLRADAKPAGLDSGNPQEAKLAAQFGVAPAETAAAPGAIQIMPLAGLSAQHMLRITNAFLDEAPRRLELARKAALAGNGPAASSAFHALKGSAGYLSSDELHRLCHQLEQLAAAGQLDQVRARLPELQTRLDQACADLRTDTHV
ncbi:hybrid sensor histidine kinase/response regulator [Pseudoduganella violacea]|uniref:Virulence sensor protein BvgS n=1 Tax=Pseudoduganella violacea TaxID=1715466 RepID=A0A7W5BCU5_9BURK|nr:signal transduction histidine kinase/DNA-binding NarL/FixJ family response regulator/HPt (histidine-containing phosphotransfer) domain-containing protein [Pseudoduganella violacea]